MGRRGCCVFASPPIELLTFHIVRAYTYTESQVAEDAGIKLMTAFQRRFDPSFARLHKVCTSCMWVYG